MNKTNQPRTIKAIVSGEAEGKPFTTTITFTRIDPDESEPYYGSGEYISVKFAGRADLNRTIDNRYARDKLEVVADRFCDYWFGENMEHKRLEFTYDHT